jgi:hypothetical protein
LGGSTDILTRRTYGLSRRSDQSNPNEVLQGLYTTFLALPSKFQLFEANQQKQLCIAIWCYSLNNTAQSWIMQSYPFCFLSMLDLWRMLLRGLHAVIASIAMGTLGSTPWKSFFCRQSMNTT